MAIAQIVVFFTFYSFLGWVWETIFCTWRKGAFQNRGFLFGPVCPIYGSSVVIAEMLFGWAEATYGGPLPTAQVFAICMLGSAVIEFSTSWYLERRFHARWWDYSHLPLNLQGRICLPVSVCFGVAGIVVVRYLLPWAAEVCLVVPALVFEALAVVLAAALGADFALTEANLSTLLKKMNEAELAFTERGEQAYQKVVAAPAEIRSRASEAGEKVLAAGTRAVERAADALPELPSLPERPELGDRSAAMQAASDRAAEIAESLSWWQQRQLRRMTGFAPSSAGERLKNALANRGGKRQG